LNFVVTAYLQKILTIYQTLNLVTAQAYVQLGKLFKCSKFTFADIALGLLRKKELINPILPTFRKDD
jgi:hypothetical protein